ncbi:MAG: element excision factor XisI family protein [Leptolyngbyaceae cyanobacterium]
MHPIIQVGKNSNIPILGCTVHVEIIDKKIRFEHCGAEDAISVQLVEKGVPKQDIVLAYHAPHVRQYTEFAAG